MANTPVIWAGAETGDALLEGQLQSGTASIVTSPVNSGARAYRTNPTGAGTGSFTFGQWSASTGKIVTLNNGGTVFASFPYTPQTLPAGTHEIMSGFYAALTLAAVVATLRITSAGLLAVYDNSNTLVATGSTALVAGTKYRIDFSANRTTGAYQVNINGVTELSGTTGGGSFGLTNIGNFSIGKTANTNGNTVDFIYDDVWVDTAAFAPYGYQMTIDVPTANGATMSWTNSDSGTGDWTHVDNVPATTANFVQDPAGTSLPVVAQFQMQTYAQMGIPVGSTIWGIMVHGYFKDGISTIGNTLKTGVISSGVKSINTTGQNTSTAYVNYGRLITTDPNTGAAWTQSGIENMQWYAEENTTGVNTNAAAALITVVYSPPTTQTQLGKSRIQLLASKTQLGVARLTKTTSQTQLGKANIAASGGITSTQTILGKTRITVTTAQAQPGKARIQITSTQTTLGKSRIGLTTPKTQPGKARITATTLQTQAGKARVTVSTLRTIQGLARVALITSKTITGKSRIQLVSAQNILGRSRITASTSKTIVGLARITQNVRQTVLGKASLAIQTNRTITGVARIAPGIVKPTTTIYLEHDPGTIYL